MESKKLIVFHVVIVIIEIIMVLMNAFVKQVIITQKMHMNVDNAIIHGFIFLNI